ncbi:MAG: inosine/xanthosine triphosphatase [bacterium]|nr:inosine/xanthosine triphosphatase [bacterium]
MKIAVGSRNPLKIEAVRNVAARVFDGVTVEGVAVDSGVRGNPLTDAETIAGAVARARAAREKTGADLGVGLEGGITRVEGSCYTCVWCAIDDGGRVLKGGGVHVPVPDRVAAMIADEGVEMGAAMDLLTSMRDTKRKMGFEGIVTRGLVDRRGSFESVVAYALSRILSPHLYD